MTTPQTYTTGPANDNAALWRSEQSGRVARRAAAPLRPGAAQEFDTSALPLFGDQRHQADLFRGA